jgi:hypothetical protein
MRAVGDCRSLGLYGDLLVSTRPSRRGEPEDDGQVGFQPAQLKKVRPGDMAVRFAFGATTSVIAGAVTLSFGPRAGGLVLAFPAILVASLTLIERKDGPEAAVNDVSGAVLGAIGLAVFAITVDAALARMSVGAAIALAFAAWLTTCLALYLIVDAAHRIRSRNR